MTSSPPAPAAEPGTLTIGTDGRIGGRTGSYVKHLQDLEGVYQDQRAFRAALDERGGDAPVYRVEEHRSGRGPGALVVGTSTLLPGRV
ncbi:cupin domain-containing protein, partial [Kineococcus indalonis]|uniref:hypothetical protein n=1 Tax=Kineococcus indalonis TaxID=2696566 RepID=UPI00196A9210